MIDELSIYVAVRTDLRMPPGKLAIQVMHAAVSLYQRCLEEFPDLSKAYRDSPLQRKICLNGKNLATLQRAQLECDAARIPTYLITDAGLTVFPEPTVTVLAIGPVRREDLPKFVGRFQLLH